MVGISFSGFHYQKDPNHASLTRFTHCVPCRCQALGEEWVQAGKQKEIPGGGSVAEYKEVNRLESLQLADAFLSYK